MAESEEGQIVFLINIDGREKVVHATPQMVEALNSNDPMVRHEAYNIVARTVGVLGHQSIASSSASSTPVFEPAGCQDSELRNQSIASSSASSTPVLEPAGCQDSELRNRSITPSSHSSTSVIEPAGCQDSEPSDVDESTSCRETDQKTYNFWSREATQLLIRLYEENQEDMENPKKQKKDIWARITECMKKEGYSFTQNKVECKWRSLLQSHKNVRDNKIQTGQKRKSFQYFQEMDSIVSKRHDICPPYTAGSGTTPQDSKKLKFSTKEGPEAGTYTEKGKKGMTEKETKSNELLEYLKASEQRRKEEQEQREKRKDERANQRNDLLRKLLEKL